MKQKDLPPDASAELRAIHQVNELHGNLVVFLTHALADLETMLFIQRDMLRQVLINQGADPDELQKILDERAIKWRETCREALMSRWTTLVQRESPLDDNIQQD
jgi:hypothetical protein